MKTVLSLLLLVVGLSACSQQNWYHGAQSAQTAHCMQQPLAEYNDCNQQSQEMTYEEYEKSREELKIRKDQTVY